MRDMGMGMHEARLLGGMGGGRDARGFEALWDAWERAVLVDGALGAGVGIEGLQYGLIFAFGGTFLIGGYTVVDSSFLGHCSLHRVFVLVYMSISITIVYFAPSFLP